MPTFAQLYAGRTDCYGEYIVLEQRDDGKLKGRGNTKQEPLPEGAYERHLRGEVMLGIVPVTTDNTVSWFAADIDDYSVGADLFKLERRAQKKSLPVVICRSKSGGAHVYCFVRGGRIKAADAQALMKRWVAALGFERAEIFPKQTKIDKGDVGSWINLPYYNASHTDRYAIGVNGEKLSLEAFLQLADARSIRPNEIKGYLKQKDEDETETAPPCIVHLMDTGLGEGGRNVALFHFGVYYIMSDPDNWQERLKELNDELITPPLPQDEVADIIGHLIKKKYEYRCNEQPMAAVCDKKVCLTRKWGVGPRRGREKGDIGDVVDYGELTVIMSDPPVYLWMINEVPVRFSSSEFIEPRAFIKRVTEKVHKMPIPRSAKSHQEFINIHLEAAKKEEAPTEVSAEGIILDQFKDWTQLNIYRANKDGDILRGLPYYDLVEGSVIFRGMDFMAYLVKKGIRTPQREVWTILKEMGAANVNRRVVTDDDARQVKIWTFPVGEPWFKVQEKEAF